MPFHPKESPPAADPARSPAATAGVTRRSLYKPAAALIAAGVAPAALAAETGDGVEGRIRALAPQIEAYVTAGMTAFDAPGVAIGIVADDRLVYAKGFGERRKGGGAPVSPGTVFQIGSTTKAIGSAMLALAVDRGKLKWDDRVVDLDPTFALKDPWVTREFRVYDLMAQRSGLPTYANDALIVLGYERDWMIHSLRFVDPTVSFRGAFTYTNITHLVAERILVAAFGAADWPTLARREFIEPLGMRDTSFTAEAIEAAPDHADGHRWTPRGAAPVPFSPNFPYHAGPAGDVNATVLDCAQWLRLQTGDGEFAGRRMISAENLGATRAARVLVNETSAYGMGWIVSDLPNGRAVWHNGGTPGFGAHIGFLPHEKVGVVVLTNLENNGLPDAIGIWLYDRLLGNPEKDYRTAPLARAKEAAEQDAARFVLRAAPRPSPPADGLAGEWANDSFGPATLAADGGGLALTLKQTGARLKLTPFDGALFTVTIAPEGRVAAVAAWKGGAPEGFASFDADADGRLSRLGVTIEGQTYVFARAGG